MNGTSTSDLLVLLFVAKNIVTPVQVARTVRRTVRAVQRGGTRLGKRVLRVSECPPSPV